MDIAAARKIVDGVLKQAETQLGADDARLDLAALALADANLDGAADRVELANALARGRIKLAGGKLIPAEEFKFDPAGPNPPVKTAADYGLKGREWYQGTFIAGGDPANPPLATKVIGSEAVAGAGQANAGLTTDQVKKLKGQGFAAVAAAAQTPADVALFLGKDIKYDNSRAKDVKPPFGAYSADEVLSLGTGVCRDQHALARDLLIANGYKAELLGYLANDQIHAITVYQDKKTGYWGMLEYGTLYPPSQLKAMTPEEALMMVRPNALTILPFDNHGPHQRSAIDRIIYTPLSRVYERFMAGPSLGAGASLTMEANANMTATASFGANRTWQSQVQIVNDPAMPRMQGAIMGGVWKTWPEAGIRLGVGGGFLPDSGEWRIGTNAPVPFREGFSFVSAEEQHDNIFQARDIAGTGINVGVSSHSRLQILLPFSLDKTVYTDGGLDLPGALGTSSIKWNPEITVERPFTLWKPGQKPDSRAFLTYGVGVDVGLLGVHYLMDGGGLPINQYIAGGFETQPTHWMAASVTGYVPLQNVSNDAAASPLVRAEVRTPIVTVGTTQGKDQARYDAAAGVTIGQVHLGGFGAIDHDRKTKRVGESGGIQASGQY